MHPSEPAVQIQKRGLTTGEPVALHPGRMNAGLDRSGVALATVDLVRKRGDSDVEAELDDVAVEHHVVLAFHAYLAGGLGGRHRPARDQIVK